MSGNALYFGLGNIATGSVSVLLLPLYSYFLPAREFGHLALAYTFIALSSILFGFGLHSALLRYWILAKSLEEKRELFASIILPLLCLGVVAAPLLYVVTPLLGTITRVAAGNNTFLALCILITWTESLSSVFYYILCAEASAKRYVTCKLVASLANIGFTIWLLVFLRLGIYAVLMAQLASQCVAALLAGVSERRYFSTRFRIPVFKELFWFGAAYVPAIIATYLLEWLDRIFLQHFCGSTAIGIFQMGNKLVFPLLIVVSAFEMAWNPYFFAVAEKENAKQVLGRTFVRLFVFVALVSAALSLFLSPLFQVRIGGFGPLLHHSYWSALQLIPQFSLMLLFTWVFYFFYCGIYIQKQNRFLSVSMVAGLAVNIICNFYFIPMWGAQGASFAKVVAWGTVALVQAAISQHFYRLPIPRFRVALFLVLAVCVNLWPAHSFSLPGILQKAIIFALLILASIMLFSKELLWKKRT